MSIPSAHSYVHWPLRAASASAPCPPTKGTTHAVSQAAALRRQGLAAVPARRGGVQRRRERSAGVRLALAQNRCRKEVESEQEQGTTLTSGAQRSVAHCQQQYMSCLMIKTLKEWRGRSSSGTCTGTVGGW